VKVIKNYQISLNIKDNEKNALFIEISRMYLNLYNAQFIANYRVISNKCARNICGEEKILL
jgi:hypothetical protein